MCRRTDTACGAIFKWGDFAMLEFIGTHTTNIDGQLDSRSTKSPHGMLYTSAACQVLGPCPGIKLQSSVLTLNTDLFSLIEVDYLNFTHVLEWRHQYVTIILREMKLIDFV